MVDGAGIPGGEAVCRHGVAWYAQRLGTLVLELVSASGDRSLASLLAEAIERVTDQHRDTCDTSSPISPSAMLAVVRVTGGRVDHLVLGDATAVLDRVRGAPLVVTDPREIEVSGAYVPALEAARTPAEREAVLGELRRRRNRPGGFWVAKDDPRAAEEALVGSHPVSAVTGVLLLSNGASRVVDRFGLSDWPGLLHLVAAAGGPDDVIARVRRAEAEHGVAPDDASVVHCTDLG